MLRHCYQYIIPHIFELGYHVYVRLPARKPQCLLTKSARTPYS